jgi:threonine dehydratase
VLRTPLRRSDWLSQLAGADVFLKLESLQPTFSYKIRDATNAVLRLVEERGAEVPPLVTASAGNHGRALGHAARDASLRLTVYVAATAPRVKIEAIRATGATLELCADYDEAERQAKARAARGDALFISPYAHPDVIAGAGTVALEILDQQPDITAIAAGIGGGGLISGIGIVARAVTDISAHGVEVEASSPFTHSLAAGHIVEIDVKPTLADGLAGNLDPDSMTFDLVRRMVTSIAVVSEEDLKQAIRGLAHEERLIAEGAGAAAVAAIASRKLDVPGQRVAAVVSGSNIDPEKFRALI